MCQACEFRAGLFAHGLLIETGVDGLYGRGGAFEDVVERFDALITSFGGGDGPEVLRFPPGMNRALFEKSGYLKSFPNLAGAVHSFNGDERGHADLLEKLADGRDWTESLEATDIALAPASGRGPRRATTGYSG